MRKIRLLGIAPYEGMRSLMVQLAAAMDDVELIAFVGDLEPGAQIAEKYGEDDVDAILSRGGTAEQIRKKTRLPVIEIELGIYDLLRSLRLAEASNSHYAVVGFPAITRNASFLRDILRYELEIYTIHNQDEARQTLRRLADNGCSMVLCDMITNSLAHEYGLPALLVTSGTESVQAALRQAVAISRVFLPLKEHARLLESVLAARARDTVLLDEGDREIFSTLSEPLPPAVSAKLLACHRAALETGAKRSTVNEEGRQYLLSGRRVDVGGKAYTTVSVQASDARPALEKYGIRYLDREEVLDHFFNSFYGTTQATATQLYEKYAESDRALLLIGEPGTGMSQMARMIYGKSRFQDAPLCLLDCALLQQKGWTYLMSNDGSPLADMGITLYIQRVESMDDAQFNQLFRTIQDTRYAKRNRLIFSCNLPEGKGLSARYQQLLRWFAPDIVELPPLRTHKEDISHLASLYLSLLNMRNAKEIVGVEPEALRLMEDYDWPGNYEQFKRVLQELARLTETPYITADRVRELMEREARLFPSAAVGSLADALQSRTLEEIERMAVHLTLTRENGNQSATAAALGISRTTLWRMLQREDAEKKA